MQNSRAYEDKWLFLEQLYLGVGNCSLLGSNPRPGCTEKACSAPEVPWTGWPHPRRVPWPFECDPRRRSWSAASTWSGTVRWDRSAKTTTKTLFVWTRTENGHRKLCVYRTPTAWLICGESSKELGIGTMNEIGKHILFPARLSETAYTRINTITIVIIALLAVETRKIAGKLATRYPDPCRGPRTAGLFRIKWILMRNSWRLN